MSVKLSFNSEDFMKDLEKELKKQVESEVKKNPAKFLEGHEGEEYSGKCPKCGHDTFIVVKDGYGKCSKCGNTAKVSFDVSWE